MAATDNTPRVPPPGTLPCPFCRSSALHIHRDAEDDEETWWVICLACHASTGLECESQSAAIRAWSTRVSPTIADRHGATPFVDRETDKECDKLPNPKPCPCCGESSIYLMFLPQDNQWWAECSDCELFGPGGRDMAAAAQGWNRRNVPAPMPVSVGFPMAARVPDELCRSYKATLEAAWPGVRINRLEIIVHDYATPELRGIVSIQLSISAPEAILIKYGFLSKADCESIPPCGACRRRDRHIGRGAKTTRVIVYMGDSIGKKDNSLVEWEALVYGALGPTVWTPPTLA